MLYTIYFFTCIPTRHLNKTIKCENLNIPLIHIYEDEWMNERGKILNLLQ